MILNLTCIFSFFSGTFTAEMMANGDKHNLNISHNETIQNGKKNYNKKFTDKIEQEHFIP